MQLKSIVMVLIFVALIFAIVGNIIYGFQTAYPLDTPINESYESKLGIGNTQDKSSIYDYTTKGRSTNLTGINTSFWDLNYRIQKIAEAESWWDRLVSGTEVIFVGTLYVIKSVAIAPAYVLAIISDIAIELKVPSMIVAILNLIIIGTVIFVIIAFIQKYRT